MMPPVSTLTEGQAVEELALILDAEPPAEDQLAHIHWAQDHTIRRQQLEQHIERLQANAPTMEPPVNDLNMPVITPTVDRLAEAVENYNVCLLLVHAAPGNSTHRYKAKQWEKRALAIARHAKMPKPALEPLPPKPGKEKAYPAAEAVPAVLEAMVLDGPPWPDPKPEPARPTPVPSARTADLDARDRHVPSPQLPPVVTDARALAFDIARSFWPLCEALDRLTQGERTAVRPALDTIHARLQVAYSVVDEAEDLAEGA